MHLRLDAINRQGKILHAEGRTEEAVALYQKEIPNWYLTSGQKTEQLFSKGTAEFAYHMKFNMLELGAFAVNKKCKELWFCNNLSVEEKGKLAVFLCQWMESLQKPDVFYEIDYYIWCFARDMALKLKHLGKDADTAELLDKIAEKAKLRFLAYSESDEVISEYCKAFFRNQIC